MTSIKYVFMNAVWMLLPAKFPFQIKHFNYPERFKLRQGTNLVFLFCPCLVSWKNLALVIELRCPKALNTKFRILLRTSNIKMIGLNIIYKLSCFKKLCYLDVNFYILVHSSWKSTNLNGLYLFSLLELSEAIFWNPNLSQTPFNIAY